MKARLLVVPHIYAENIRIREIEFARRMTDFFEVYCLKWEDALHVDDSMPMRRRWRQFSTALRSLIKQRSVSSESYGVSLLNTPVLQPILLRRIAGSRRAGAISRARNRRQLEKWIVELGITHALLAPGYFDLPSRASGARLFMDFVDWFPEESSNLAEMATLRENMVRYRRGADGFFAVSEPLAEKLKADYSLDCIPMPNGADITTLRNVDAAKVEAVRNRWGLQGKFVIGYIGNHGSYTGVDFMVQAYTQVLQRIPDAVLFVVGPAEYWIPKLGIPPPGVIFTGAVPPDDIPPYFQVLDVGVMAKDVSLGTEFAFQLKIVEYTACRKFVISTPQIVWKRMGWPNVRLVERHTKAWADAICELKDAKWRREWDSLAEAYDWGALAHELAKCILAPGLRGKAP